MPYIEQPAREEMWQGRMPKTAGELNYMFTFVIKNYLGKEFNYQKINDVIGALEGCKLEFYRRVAAPYENTKIESNGDVY
jgi:hypothetical protein